MKTSQPHNPDGPFPHGKDLSRHLSGRDPVADQSKLRSRTTLGGLAAKLAPPQYWEDIPDIALGLQHRLPSKVVHAHRHGLVKRLVTPQLVLEPCHVS